MAKINSAAEYSAAEGLFVQDNVMLGLQSVLAIVAE